MYNSDMEIFHEETQVLETAELGQIYVQVR